MSIAVLYTELAHRYASLTSDKYMSLLKGVEMSRIHWDINHRIAWLAGIGVLLYALLTGLNALIFVGVKAPKVGRRSFWEPRWLIGLRFARDSAPMVLEGYNKVSSSQELDRMDDVG